MPTPSAAALRAYPVLAGLPEELAARLTREARPFRVPAGAVLFDVGSPCGGFVLVLEGAIEVSRPHPDGREILLYRLAPGDTCVLTLNALLADGVYAARAVATTGAAGMLLPRPLFARLLAEAPAFRDAMLVLLARRLDRVVELLEATAFAPVEQRLASALLDAGPVVRATHQHLADEVGSVREVVSRHLGAWARAGWVETHRGEVRVLDREALARLAEPLGG